MTQFDVGRRSTLKAIGAGLAAAGLFGGTAAADGGNLQQDLAAVRSATAKYHDPAVAYADGYLAFDHDGNAVSLEDVVSNAEAVCGMGYHFVNGGLMGTVDRLLPQVLVYGVDDDGDLLLGAVEYIVPTSAVPTAGAWFHGHDDHWEPFFIPDTSALHVWVHTHNPDGVFNHSNPRKQFSPEGCLGH